MYVFVFTKGSTYVYIYMNIYIYSCVYVYICNLLLLGYNIPNIPDIDVGTVPDIPNMHSWLTHTDKYWTSFCLPIGSI